MSSSTEIENKMNLRKRCFAAVNENNSYKDDIIVGAPDIKCRDIQATSFTYNDHNKQNNFSNGICETNSTCTTDSNSWSCITTQNLDVKHKQEDENLTNNTDESIVQNDVVDSHNSSGQVNQMEKNNNNKLCETNDGGDGNTSLANCCEEILMEIFKNLPINDLISIMRTCKRFERISRDRRFWHHVSVINCTNTHDELSNVLKFCNDTLKTLKLRGLDIPLPSSEENDEIIENFTVSLKQTIINGCKLTVLELYSIQFDKKLFRVCHLPKTLKCLVLSGCRISQNYPSENYRRSSWLHGINLYATNLEILCIEYCTWFYPDDLMSISKLRELHTLSLRGCVRFFDIVAYGSISTLYGFTKLKSLDLRHVPLRDSDLQCFNAVHTLREIKLECYPFMNEEESMYRQLMIEVDDNSSIPIQCPPFVPIEDNLESNNNPMRVIYVDFRNTLQGNNNPQPLQMNAQPTVNVNVNVNANANQLNHPSNSDNNTNGRDGHDGHDDANEGNEIIPAYMRQVLIRDVNVTARRNVITNLGVCAFGSAPRQVHPHRIWISVRQRPKDTLIERFIVRNYKDVTDRFLNHLEQCTPNIIYLDVTGTNCTANGIERFRKIKPNCKIIADHC